MVNRVVSESMTRNLDEITYVLHTHEHESIEEVHVQGLFYQKKFLCIPLVYLTRPHAKRSKVTTSYSRLYLRTPHHTHENYVSDSRKIRHELVVSECPRA